MTKSKIKNTIKCPDNTTQLLKSLKPSSDECLVITTAQEMRRIMGLTGILSKQGVRLKTAKGENGTVNVWRIK